ncbi:acyl-CoA dehydrogenase family protein [Actinomadura harenae]|uniref:Acyl-CoA dehydrogenase n=1 Tax=Actinomadura harenae TaxID=2483351 RepID=A0A3M2LVM3_9ACTN|nr:acyl-CoA dehydrogenase family protein [Actinomadura harenae]RMI41156.1 acyl-CoA dehydrogenase [Actinomadura harenae]
MEFDLDEAQRELRSLAADLLGREAAPQRLEAFEKTGAAYDPAIWKALAQAGLLGVVVPEDRDGAGLGPVGMTVLLREVGAHVAPVPAYATLALAALPIALTGTDEQKELLAGVASGETVLTGAYREAGPSGTVGTTVRGGRLTGTKTFVPYADEASHLLVPARADDGTVQVHVVERSEARVAPQPSATSEPLSRVELDGAHGTPLGAGGWDAFRRSAVTGAVALSSGVIEGALKLTTEYVKTREQFDRALAQFQAVTMQIGDVYIAKRALDVAVWAGAWRFETGSADTGDTDEVLAIAAYNASDAVVKALYTCQHLHGGIGLDVTYPLHRYFAWAKQIGHLLGGAEDQLDTLGALVAAQEVL